MLSESHKNVWESSLLTWMDFVWFCNCHDQLRLKNDRGIVSWLSLSQKAYLWNYIFCWYPLWATNSFLNPKIPMWMFYPYLWVGEKYLYVQGGNKGYTNDVRFCWLRKMNQVFLVWVKILGQPCVHMWKRKRKEKKRKSK